MSGKRETKTGQIPGDLNNIKLGLIIIIIVTTITTTAIIVVSQ
jgi:hypothetical protein